MTEQRESHTRQLLREIVREEIAGAKAATEPRLKGVNYVEWHAMLHEVVEMRPFGLIHIRRPGGEHIVALASECWPWRPLLGQWVRESNAPARVGQVRCAQGDEQYHVEWHGPSGEIVGRPELSCLSALRPEQFTPEDKP